MSEGDFDAEETFEEEPWLILGSHAPGGILVVSDHASNRVPPHIDLGIAPELLGEHVAVDIGVREVGAALAQLPGFSAFQGNISRLVCDLNRDPHFPGVVPHASDGYDIPGNVLDMRGHLARLTRYHAPYHQALRLTLEAAEPALIVSLHSFTPRLASEPEVERPWQVGVLYNADDRAARIAIPLLEAEGLIVGDQLPYSGETLNYTMDRHAEVRGRPYLGIEIRQDEIADSAGQACWAERLARIACQVKSSL